MAWKRYTQSIENRDRTCILCGTAHRAVNTQAWGLFCPSCRTPQLDHEDQRVRKAVGRAKRLGLPATLTILEWLRILDHFNWKCAYCGHKFEIIEHITSTTVGGGTTHLNCVPGCLGCNAIKDRVLRPDSMPVEKITHVRNELSRIFQ